MRMMCTVVSVSQPGFLRAPTHSKGACVAATRPARAAMLRASWVRRCNRRLAAQAGEKSSGASVDTLEETKSVELSTADMNAAVGLLRLRAGPGYAIVVASVEPGSEAAAAGVRPGQQLLQVSDPIRGNEMWVLNENSSLRYVRQAIRMRVPDSITLVLTPQPIPEWQQHVDATRAAAQQRAAEQQLQVQPADPAPSSGSFVEEGDSDLLSNIVEAASASDTDDDTRQRTVADQLKQQFAQQQGGAVDLATQAQQQVQRELTALEKRQQRRKEYFEQDSKRNDGPFFAAVAALFVLPPGVILLWAWSSGLLDRLDIYGQLR